VSPSFRSPPILGDQGVAKYAVLEYGKFIDDRAITEV
jgi:hypothetical protein